MYKLTLTREERNAIDWVGYRYSNGDDLKELICKCTNYKSDHYTDNAWVEAENITFYIPEHIAWQIADNAREEDGDGEYTFPCFASELAEKMIAFCFDIV